ncbi:hypothetical protein [Pseudolysinimonas sp.]|jgi:hypothetical protein|uniref:hypothetical protein n=1 Tax=Pseudolysinimonas sp. TaxID=2680009 RepID=UPI0037850FB7
MTPDAALAPPGPRVRNRLGIVALVLALVAGIAPLVAWIATGVVGMVENPGDVDTAVYVGLLGGGVVFVGAIALLSPLSLVAAVLGVVSMWRPGSRAPGIVAIVVGVIGSLGLFGLPLVLGELVPGR